jgi:thiamine biosynthesis lipoprotein ApbE
MTADALATAVFVMGPEKGYSLCLKMKGVDCLILSREGKTIFSPGLRGFISFAH